jgi:hypothetical protein
MGLEPRAPELEIPRPGRGADPVGGRNGKEGVVEGFRVLTLLYRVEELPPSAFQRLVEFFKMYRAIGALYFWSKRLNLDEGVGLALERAKLLPSYYRHAFDEESRVYQFGEVEKNEKAEEDDIAAAARRCSAPQLWLLHQREHAGREAG